MISNYIKEYDVMVQCLYQDEHMITSNLSRKVINTVSEKANLIWCIIRNALAYRNDSTEHSIVAFVGAFLP